MDGFFENFKKSYLPATIDKSIEAVLSSKPMLDSDHILALLQSIDHTSLNTDDSSDSVIEQLNKINHLYTVNPVLPKPAAVCLFPVFAPLLNSYLKVPQIGKAVVAGGFPSSQTFLDVKLLEVKKAVAFGANEIDIVISVGEFLDGNYEFVFEEVRAIKEVCGKAKLKVILETGLLKSEDQIWYAALVAMEAGADFVKTSTGKVYPGANLSAVYVLLQAIKEYQRVKGRLVGLKVSGGISEIDDALDYMHLATSIMGNDYINPDYFRIGASKLTNKLLSFLLQKEDNYI